MREMTKLTFKKGNLHYFFFFFQQALSLDFQTKTATMIYHQRWVQITQLKQLNNYEQVQGCRWRQGGWVIADLMHFKLQLG